MMNLKYEYKYLVPDGVIDELRAFIRPYVIPDEHSLRTTPREYAVRSIYCDTPGLACYHEKVEGAKVRRKYRVRGYNDPDSDSLTFLEIKRKYVNMVGKTRTPVPWCDLRGMISGLRVGGRWSDCLPADNDGDSAKPFLYHYFRCGLVPTVLVVYNREAFHGRFDPTLRVTFDKRLRSTACTDLACLYHEQGLKPALRHRFVLEVKFFRGVPAWIRTAIERFELQRLAVSKYAICMASHGQPKGVRPGLRLGLSLHGAEMDMSERISA